MLTYLCIRNFTLIESIDLEIPPQLSIITGETGAGKSILIGALDLLIGRRATADCIRKGAEQADIAACFDITNNSDVKQWLNEHALLDDEHCLIRRVISKDGRSRSFINGRASTLSDLKTVSEQLLSIHGQHQNQLLLKKEYQLYLLDQFADSQPLQTDNQRAYHRLQSIQKRIKEQQTAQEQQHAKRALLQYQVDELTALSLLENEFQHLEQQHQMLANADQRIASSQQILTLLDTHPERNIVDDLHRAQQALELIQNDDPALKEIGDMLSNANILISEANDSLQRYIDTIEHDPQKLSTIENRLATLHQIARKHKVDPNALSSHLSQLIRELDAITQSDAAIKALETEATKTEAQLNVIAEQLSAHRRSAIPALEAAVTKHIKTLGLPHAQFAIKIVPLDKPTPHGREQIEFMISTNPGQPINPLRKVASGGELSRISLAIQVICSTKEVRPPTMVFDEVDVGVGGAVAESVGCLLRQLGEQGQVICITHLPQVAAQGHHHMHVNKIHETNNTYTKIDNLSTDEKVLEIARMLGGIEISDQTIAHAKEMLGTDAH